MSTGNVTRDVNATWVIDAGFDYDLDGSMDVFVQRFDACGGTNFTDGIDDVVRIDANANGVYEVELSESVTTTPWTSGDGSTGALVVTVTSTTRVDANENGIAEQTSTDWASIVSNTQSRCMAVSWNGSTFVPANWEFGDQQWSFGYTDDCDWDADGMADFTRQATDEFDDAGPLGGRTYETKIDTIASWTWDTNSSTWLRNVTTTVTNDLLTRNVMIVALGLNQTVTADFVVVDGVDVIIDPRESVVPTVRIAENGSLFWFDSNHDGLYEGAYVLIEETRAKAVPEAVGVLLDRDMDTHCDVEAVLSGTKALTDAYVPLSWLSTSAGYEYITGMAYDDAWHAHDESWHDPTTWGRMIADTGFQIVNMLGIMALTTVIGAVCGPVGALVGLVVGFFAGLLTNLAYQSVAATVSDIIDMQMAKNPDRGVNILDDGKMEGVTFLDAAGEQVGESVTASTAAMNAVIGMVNNIWDSGAPIDWYRGWEHLLPPGSAKKYYWRGVVATGVANATRTYSIGTVWGAQLAGVAEDIEIGYVNGIAVNASKRIVDDTVGVVLRLPDVWLAPSDVAAWWDFGLGWVPWRFDWSGSNTGMPVAGTDWDVEALAHYAADATREVYGHFANRTLPAALALAASNTGGELDGITATIDGSGRVSFVLVNTSTDTGNPCNVDPSSAAGFGAMCGIAAYAGLYQSTYAYTQERDAGMQAYQLAIQVVQIVATIVAGQAIARASGLSKWMGEVAARQQGLGGLTNNMATKLGWQAWAKFIVKALVDELIVESIASTYAVAWFDAVGFEGYTNDFLNIDLSAAAIAEQIGESWFDATIGGDMIGAFKQAAGGKVSVQQAAMNQEIVNQFLQDGAEGSAELDALLERVGGLAVARLAAMAQRIGGQGPQLAQLLDSRLRSSLRLTSEFLTSLFYDNKFIKSTFPAEVYAAIKQDPGAVAAAMAADILLAEDWESVGDAINAAGSNTRIATGMDAHLDKQVDLHVRMRDGSVQVVNSLNPMTKEEFLAGVVKVVKVTDTATSKTVIKSTPSLESFLHEHIVFATEQGSWIDLTTGENLRNPGKLKAAYDAWIKRGNTRLFPSERTSQNEAIRFTAWYLTKHGVSPRMLDESIKQLSNIGLGDAIATIDGILTMGGQGIANDHELAEFVQNLFKGQREPGQERVPKNNPKPSDTIQDVMVNGKANIDAEIQHRMAIIANPDNVRAMTRMLDNQAMKEYGGLSSRWMGRVQEIAEISRFQDRLLDQDVDATTSVAMVRDMASSLKELQRRELTRVEAKQLNTYLEAGEIVAYQEFLGAIFGDLSILPESVLRGENVRWAARVGSQPAGGVQGIFTQTRDEQNADVFLAAFDKSSQRNVFAYEMIECKRAEPDTVKSYKHQQKIQPLRQVLKGGFEHGGPKNVLYVYSIVPMDSRETVDVESIVPVHVPYGTQTPGCPDVLVPIFEYLLDSNQWDLEELDGDGNLLVAWKSNQDPMGLVLKESFTVTWNEKANGFEVRFLAKKFVARAADGSIIWSQESTPFRVLMKWETSGRANSAYLAFVLQEINNYRRAHGLEGLPIGFKDL